MTERKDYNSSTNQSIKRQFVEREVISLATSLVEYILKQHDYSDDAPFSWDDVENLYMYPERSINVDGENFYFYGGSEEDKEEFIVELEKLEEEYQDKFKNDPVTDTSWNNDNSEITEICKTIDKAISEFEELETEPQEVYEWWIVSDFLYNKLKDHNEVVLTDGYLTFWGRSCSGQAILLDNVISEICNEMEILDGQKYSWADKN